MWIEELVKGFLRIRILVVHPMIPGFEKPSARNKRYLLLGSDNDIQDFTDRVNAIWPVRQNTFLI